MLAVLEFAGKQYMVEEGTVLRTFAQNAEPGEAIVCNQVLLIKNGGGVKVGKPYVEGASATLEVLRHDRGPKVIVFKFKPKKNYKRTFGHRDHLTYLKCTGINAG